MKEKILAQLKIKFPNLGFTDKAFEGVAAYLATTVTEEANIETALSAGVDALLKAFQGDADSRVNSAIEKTKKELTPPGPGDDKDKKEPITPPANETPSEKLLRETLEQMQATNKALLERVEKIETGGAVVSRKTALETMLKDAPEAYKTKVLGQFEKMSPFLKEEEAYNTWRDSLASKEVIEAEIQSASTNGVKSLVRPVVGTTKVTDGKSTTFADTLKGAVDSKIEENEKAAKN